MRTTPLSSLIGLTALAIAPIAMAQNIPFEHDGITRNYRLHLPEQAPERMQDSMPLVLVLHGYGGSNGDMFNNYGWTELADEEGFAVACPNGTRDQWNNRFWDVDYDFHQQLDIDDDGFLVALAKHLQETHGLDPERTFVTGYSNGAEMCFQLACRESEHFAGFGPVIGMMLDTLFEECDPAIPRPIISMNGTNDPITLFDGDPFNTGGWGAYKSIPETMAFWASVLQTPFINSTNLPDLDPNDGSTVRLDKYTGPNPTTLWYYLVIGGEHDWPGQNGNMDIDATTEVWNFFADIAPEDPPSPADFNLDGAVNGPDLAYLLSNWGPNDPDGDLDGDGATNAQDLTILLAAWTG